VRSLTRGLSRDIVKLASLYIPFFKDTRNKVAVSNILKSLFPISPKIPLIPPRINIVELFDLGNDSALNHNPPPRGPTYVGAICFFLFLLLRSRVWTPSALPARRIVGTGPLPFYPSFLFGGKTIWQMPPLLIFPPFV